MNYKFTTKPYGWDGDFGLDYDSLSENEKKLSEIGWWGWTPEKVQMIIDKSNSLTGDEEYDYQVEGSDFDMMIKKSEVLMWARGSETPDVIWSFNKFIEFMEAFKKFIEENQ